MTSVYRISRAIPLLFLLACAPSPEATKAAADAAAKAGEAAIRAIDVAWNAALVAQNDSAIGAIYAADAELLPPDMPRVTGTAAIRQLFAGMWMLKAKLVLEPVSIRVLGEWAIEEGNWTFSVPTTGGDTKDHGKYLVTWRQEGGQWRAVQDIWNSDVPKPPVAMPKAGH
jgi:uncharacterized protein (TIGR02246 family)